MSQFSEPTQPLIPVDKMAAPAICFHCGETCPNTNVRLDEKLFCCLGCKTAYQLLNDKNLCTYYDLNVTPGEKISETELDLKFVYLDDESIQQQLIVHSDGSKHTFALSIPSIHCSSCVYVLEKLYKLDPGILYSQVDFMQKRVTLKYDAEKTTIRKIVEVLVSLGYEPDINLSNIEQSKRNHTNKDLYIKIGIAGFAFGNIMLMSLPDYLAIKNEVDPGLQRFFSYLNLLLALPVLLISARDYFKSAYMGFRQGLINIDVPISLGILALFIRSSFEIISQSGVGYMDSFAALVFLLLLGKLFQQKTFDTLSFDRDYRSYFPISVVVKTTGGEKHIPLTKLKVGDRIVVRNEELIPADSILIHDNATIDFSFVTGESAPVDKQVGDLIYAGGRQKGGAIELDVVNDVSQSYLTQLWNKDIYSKHSKSKLINLTDMIGKYFTIIIILVASGAALYWLPKDVFQAVNAFTAVLIIACPCALALSAPFALGTALRIFGKNDFYLKNTNVIESLAKIKSIVFDKTGTLTKVGKSQIQFYSPENTKSELSVENEKMIRSVARQSNHPLSQQIYNSLTAEIKHQISDYREIPGQGIEGTIEGKKLKLGSPSYIGYNANIPQATTVFASVNDAPLGYFKISNSYRESLKSVLIELKSRFTLSLLSGDKDWERDNLKRFFPEENIHFDQSPFDKLSYIKNLQEKSQQVLMIGDGLNDAGSLKQSNVGVSISEDKNAFSPACDGILGAKQFKKLPDLLKLSRYAVKIIYISFGISFLYNILGLSFAVTGRLSPLISAVLMPISSISVVAFATLSTNFMSARCNLSD